EGAGRLRRQGNLVSPHQRALVGRQLVFRGAQGHQGRGNHAAGAATGRPPGRSPPAGAAPGPTVQDGGTRQAPHRCGAGRTVVAFRLERISLQKRICRRTRGAAELMTELKLKTVTRSQGNNQALKDGTVKPRTFAFEFEEVDPLIAAFRRMVRGNEFDICEMAITTYICAKAHGKPMTAVPVFLVRAFHHGAILVNAKAGIRTPKDLEGRKVGVNRGYTVTTGVWARSILQDEHGVDLSKITWV